MTEIIRLNKDYEGMYEIDDRYALFIDPIWTSEYEEYEVREPIEYIIAIVDDSLEIVDDHFEGNDVSSITISAFLYNEPQTIIVGDDEIEYTIDITLLDKNRIKIEIK